MLWWILSEMVIGIQRMAEHMPSVAGLRALSFRGGWWVSQGLVWCGWRVLRRRATHADCIEWLWLMGYGVPMLAGALAGGSRRALPFCLRLARRKLLTQWMPRIDQHFSADSDVRSHFHWFVQAELG